MSRYIDADDLKMELIGWETEHTDEEIERVIDNMPTADVAPVVHGHWEWVTEDKYRCSACGAETRVDECFGEPMYKGCPYCLAIMDGEDGKADGTI